MSKGILEFNLPEERVEFGAACKAGKMQSALYDFHNYLRNQYKHSNYSDECMELLEKIKKEFFNILEVEKIDLFE